MFVGLVLLGGVVAGIVSLVDFMKTNDIQFIPNKAGTTAITMSELALHSTPDDCWVVLHGDVYDLTNFVKHHPGGSSIITQLAGRDGTQGHAQFYAIKQCCWNSYWQYQQQQYQRGYKQQWNP
jgi:cytochrome b involved in lipid metabolism